MNKDKIIKDLKERNDKLQSQYMQEQARNYSLNYLVNSCQKEIRELQQRIDKAIKYINENLTEDDNGCGCWWYSLNYYETPDKLLNILRGKDENSNK